MTHTLFFSWQTDTDKSGNRNYIESCLKKALSKIRNGHSFKLDYRIDQATDKKQGTPDISDSIFRKINLATVFVADVTLINGSSRKKKVPNPNVLIELGYAARVLGWENIICIFNTKYGKIESLPFDIKGRRIMCYNSEDPKSKLVDLLSDAIENTKNYSIPSSIVRDYYNAPIYTTLLQLISDCGKSILGYEQSGLTTKRINAILNLKKEDILDRISNNYLLGFQLFKVYTKITEQLVSQTEKILSIRLYDDSFYVPLISIINILRLYDKEINRRGDLDKLEFHSKNFNYDILKNAESSGLCRFVLTKKIEGDTSLRRVIDFGDFERGDHKKALLNEYRLSPISVQFYSGFYAELLSNINKWIDNNGGEYILDETVLEMNQHGTFNTDSNSLIYPSH